jgi:hypothetical protein
MSISLYLIVFQIFKRLKQLRDIINFNFFPFAYLKSLKRPANLRNIVGFTNKKF